MMTSLTAPESRVSGSSATPSGSDCPPKIDPPNRMVLHYRVKTGDGNFLCGDLALRSGLWKLRVKRAMSNGAVWIKRKQGRRRVEKGYHAVLKGRLKHPSGWRTIDIPLDGKPAVTRYRVLRGDTSAERTAVQIRLATGRRHQIRRHFDATGYPVLGDPRYGRGQHEPCGLRLWASSLAFVCPQCQRKHVYARPPAQAVMVPRTSPSTKDGTG